MTDETPSKSPFWSSVPGIFTGLGAVIVAVTGLITALYSVGAFGTKDGSNFNANAERPASQVALAATPAPVNPEHERYKNLAGRWEVIETPSQYFDVDKVTWQYEATVAGNNLTLTGKVVALDDDKNIPREYERVRGTLVTTLVESGGIGKYTLRKVDASEVSNRANLILEDDLKEFTGTFKEDGTTYTLAGRKQ